MRKSCLLATQDEEVAVKKENMKLNPNLKFFRHHKSNLNQLMPSGLDFIDSNVNETVFHKLSYSFLFFCSLVTGIITIIFTCKILRFIRSCCCKCKFPSCQRKYTKSDSKTYSNYYKSHKCV